jgi:hypothetical protein
MYGREQAFPVLYIKTLLSIGPGICHILASPLGDSVVNAQKV